MRAPTVRGIITVGRRTHRRDRGKILVPVLVAARPVRQGIAQRLDPRAAEPAHQLRDRNPRPVAARHADLPAGDHQRIHLAVAERRIRMRDREPDQLVARRQRRLVHGPGHQVGELRSAGDRRPRQRRIAELHAHILDRHAQRFGRGLRQDRVGAGTHVDAAAGDLDRAVGEDADQCLPGGAADRIGAGGDAPADERVSFPHGARRRACAATSRRPPRRPRTPRAAAVWTRACSPAGPPPHSSAGGWRRGRCRPHRPARRWRIRCRRRSGSPRRAHRPRQHRVHRHEVLLGAEIGPPRT